VSVFTQALPNKKIDSAGTGALVDHVLMIAQ
jgi:hypothetical protein